MATAAYQKKLQVAAVGSTDWKDVPCTSPTLDLSSEVLETTDLANNARVIALAYSA